MAISKLRVAKGRDRRIPLQITYQYDLITLQTKASWS